MSRLAVIICEWGIGERRERSRINLRLTLACQTADFKCFWVSAGESAGGDTTYSQEILLPWDPAAEGLWQKEALWNVGAREAINQGFDQLVFVDMDVYTKDPTWLGQIQAQLSEGQDNLVQGFRFVLDDRKSSWSYQSVVSQYQGLDSDLEPNPGLVWGMNSRFFLRMGGMNPLYYLGGGDSGFVSEVLECIPGVERVAHLRRSGIPQGVPCYVGVDLKHTHHGFDTKKYGKRIAIYSQQGENFTVDIEVSPTGLLCRIASPLMVFPVTKPSWGDTCWRRGEEEFLESALSGFLTDNVSLAAAIWCRPVSELVTDVQSAEIRNFIELYPDKCVLNHIDQVHRFSCKEETLRCWAKNGIQCPEVRVIGSYSDLTFLVDRRWLVRINNTASSGWIFRLGGSGLSEKDWSTLETQRDLRKKGCIGTKIIATEFIGDWTGPHCHGVAYVVGSKVVGIIAYGKHTMGGMVVPGAFSDFIGQNEAVTRLKTNERFLSDLVKSVSVLGLDMASVDFLLVKGQVWFLEANSFWGLGEADSPFNSVWVEKVKEERLLWEDRVPDVFLLLDHLRFWGEVYSAIRVLLKGRVSSNL